MAPRLLAAEVVGLSSIVICGLAIVCFYIQFLGLLNFLVHFPLIVPALCVYNSKMLAQSKYLTLGDYWWLFDLHHLIPKVGHSEFLASVPSGEGDENADSVGS